MHPNIEHLISLMKKIHGLGPKSSRRLVLHLLKNQSNLMLPIIKSMKHTADSIISCALCGNLDCNSPCSICSSNNRDRSMICLVEEVSDLWSFENGKFFKGLYHVLGGKLSAFEGIGPEDLNINSLVEKISTGEHQEVIIATNATLEGRTTGYYVADLLKKFDIKISFLAHGIPMGGEIDYLDEGTLNAALLERRGYNF